MSSLTTKIISNAILQYIQNQEKTQLSLYYLEYFIRTLLTILYTRWYQFHNYHKHLEYFAFPL